MMTWNSVDLPEPVLPAISACCRVPLPMARYCSFVAPLRPRLEDVPSQCDGRYDAIAAISICDIARRPLDQFEGQFIARLVVVGPVNQPVPTQDHALSGWVLAHYLL